jgi:hypothetical protein
MRPSTKSILFLLPLFTISFFACGNPSLQTEPATPIPYQPAVQVITPITIPTLIPAKDQTMTPFTPIRGEQIMIQTAALEQNAKGRWELRISGQLPTPCHQINLKTTVHDGKINLEVSGSPEADVMCAQVISDFEETIPLPDLPSGNYQVFINGILVGVIQG